MSTNRLAMISDGLAGWQYTVTWTSDQRSPLMGREVPTHFRGSFSYDQNRRLVDLACQVRDGDVIATYTLMGFDDDELESLGLPKMRDLLTIVAGETPPEDRARAAGELHRRRRKNAFSDERIARAAEAYRTDGIEGVRSALGSVDAPLGVRQAWRYVERAIDLGLVEPRVRARKGTS